MKAKRFYRAVDTEEEYDEYDWRDFYIPNGGAEPDVGEKASGVAPDGATVLFTSQAQLTSYDNAKQDELYLYETSDAKLMCVSCNPNGVPATSETYLANNGELGFNPNARVFLTRNLSKDGSRVFFQTKEALVPQDTNEQADVYEWGREGDGGAQAAHMRARASAQARVAACT